jgi:hypothetical protein
VSDLDDDRGRDPVMFRLPVAENDRPKCGGVEGVAASSTRTQPTPAHDLVRGARGTARFVEDEVAERDAKMFHSGGVPASFPLRTTLPERFGLRTYRRRLDARLVLDLIQQSGDVQHPIELELMGRGAREHTVEEELKCRRAVNDEPNALAVERVQAILIRLDHALQKRPVVGTSTDGSHCSRKRHPCWFGYGLTNKILDPS